LVLALGTALAGIGYCLAGFSNGVVTLVAALFVGGLGASVQHPWPRRSSRKPSRACARARRSATYNFAGDIGKMTLPATASLLFVVAALAARADLLGSFGVLARSRSMS